jgi:hypothetical protein
MVTVTEVAAAVNWAFALIGKVLPPFHEVYEPYLFALPGPALKPIEPQLFDVIMSAVRK